MKAVLKKRVAVLLIVAMVFTNLTSAFAGTGEAVQAEPAATQETVVETEPIVINTEEEAAVEIDTEIDTQNDETEVQIITEEANADDDQDSAETSVVINTQEEEKPEEEIQEEVKPEEEIQEEVKPEEKIQEEVVPEEENTEEAFHDEKVVGKIKVMVDAEPGVVPKGAVLDAFEVKNIKINKDIDAAVEEVREEDVNVAGKKNLNIKLKLNGKEIEPNGSLKVSFALAEVVGEAVAVNIYHMAEENNKLTATSLDTTEEVVDNADDEERNEETVVSAETDGFSYYTVEFTYGDLQYVMEGDTEIPLSVIQETIGLLGTVSDATVSSPELFSIEKDKEGDDWTVIAHQAFDTTEWTKLTIGENVYEVVVTDAPGDTEQEDTGRALITKNGVIYSVYDNKIAKRKYNTISKRAKGELTRGQVIVSGVEESKYFSTELTIINPSSDDDWNYDVVGISSTAFDNCTNLKQINIDINTPPTGWGVSAFPETIEHFVVPRCKAKSYKATEKWNDDRVVDTIITLNPGTESASFSEIKYYVAAQDSENHGILEKWDNPKVVIPDQPWGTPSNAATRFVYWKFTSSNEHTTEIGDHVALLLRKIYPNDTVEFIGSNYKLTAYWTRSPIKTAPQAKELSFDGTAQELVNPAEVHMTEGDSPEPAATIEYNVSKFTSINSLQSIDDDNWSTSVPKATDADSYVVFYRAVVNDEDYAYVGSQTNRSKGYTYDYVIVTIDKADVSRIEVATDSFVYNGNVQIPQISKLYTGTGASEKEIINSGDIGTLQALLETAVSTKRLSEKDFAKASGSYTSNVYASLTTNNVKVENVSVYWSITPATIATENVTVTGVVPYNEGQEIGPNIEVHGVNAELLTEGSDYIIDGVKTATDSGTYSVTIIGKGNYVGTVTKSWELTKNYQFDLCDCTVELSTESTIYNGQAQTTEVKRVYCQFNGKTITLDSDFYEVDEASSSCAATNAGNYDVTVVRASGSNCKGYAVATWEIKQATHIATPPTAKTGLVYTGIAQPLVNAGSSSTGTILYSLDGLNYSEDVPVATDAKAGYSSHYDVQWKVVDANNNYADKKPEHIYVQINKATPIVNVQAAENLLYNGNAQELFATASTSFGTLEWHALPNDATLESILKDGDELLKLILGIGWTDDIPIATDSGTYNYLCRVEESSNWDSRGKKLTDIIFVSSKISGIPIFNPETDKAPEIIQQLIYNGTDQEIISKLPECAALASDSSIGKIWYQIAPASTSEYRLLDPPINDASPSKIVVTNAGKYEFTWGIERIDKNYESYVSETSVLVTMDKVTPKPTAPTPKIALYYNGLKQDIMKPGKTDFGQYLYITLPITEDNLSVVSDSLEAIIKIGTNPTESLIDILTTLQNYDGIRISTTTPSEYDAGMYLTYWMVIPRIFDDDDLSILDTIKELQEISSIQDLFSSGKSIAEIIRTVIGALADIEGNKAKLNEIRNVNIKPGGLVLPTTILPKVAIGEWSNLALEYNGSEQGPDFRITNLLASDSCIPTITGKAVDAGAHVAYLSDMKITAIREGEEVDVTHNYNVLEINKITAYVITKADIASVSDPEFKTDLVYTGEAQNLVATDGVAYGIFGEPDDSIKFQYAIVERDSSIGAIGDYIGMILPSKWKSMDEITAVDAGDYVVYYRIEGNKNYNDLPLYTQKHVTVTIAKAKATESNVTVWPEAADITYNGANQKLLATPAQTDAGTIQYRNGDAGTFTTTLPSGKNAGDYTVYFKIKGDKNHEDSEIMEPIPCTIKLADAAITATPSANILTYNGQSQNLCTAGRASGGSFFYYVAPGTASDPDYTSGTSTVPTAKEAGDYKIWYYVHGDGNHNNSPADGGVYGPIVCTIEKADIEIIASPSALSLTYTGEAQELISPGTASVGTFKYATSSNPNEWSEEIPTATDAGAYEVYYIVDGGDNYNVAGPFGPINVSVNRKPYTMITAPTGIDRYYDGTVQNLVTAGVPSDGGTMLYKIGKTGIYRETIPTASEIGNYDVYVKITGDDNHAEFVYGPITVSITKKPSSSGGSGGGGTAKAVAPEGSVTGAWQYIPQTDKWTFISQENRAYHNEWAYILNSYAQPGQQSASWYFFDANGIMLTGYQWIPSLAGGYRLFYFHEAPDGDRGRMYTNQATPDGNWTDATGWVYINGALQQK